MSEQLKNLLDVVFSFINTSVVVIGAIWAYRRFFREGTHNPRIEFSIECQFYGPHHDSYLAAFTVFAANKGNVEQRFKEIRLKVLGIKTDQPLQNFEKLPPMVAFPEELIRGFNLVPEKFGYYFVRPGVNQAFSFFTHIPQDISFIVARTTFKYEGTNQLHTAEKVFEVKTDTSALPPHISVPPLVGPAISLLPRMEPPAV